MGPVATRFRPGNDARMEMPQTKYAKTVDGVHIAYSVSGSGSIDLVWAPGTVSHVEVYWDEPRLARFDRPSRLLLAADAL